MKKIAHALLSGFIVTSLYAQDVRLNDSVIFINNKPVALYTKELNDSPLRYNMEVYSFDDYVLIKAEVIQFNAAVDDLKPFYYYEISFPPFNDTVAVYVIDEAFPLVLAKIIRDYKLINNNQLSGENLAYFKSVYPGKQALTAKIIEVTDYLNETRYFDEQVVRDRTKPVTIIGGKIIMQDGVNIGTIRTITVNRSASTSSRPVGTSNRYFGEEQPNMPKLESQSSYNNAEVGSKIIYLKSERPAIIKGYNLNSKNFIVGDRGYQLYELSKPKNVTTNSIDDQVLRRICYLVEDYSL